MNYNMRILQAFIEQENENQVQTLKDMSLATYVLWAIFMVDEMDEDDKALVDQS